MADRQETTEKPDKAVDDLANLLDQKAKVTEDENEDVASSPASEALQKFAKLINNGQVKKILVVAGAGMSVSAGIPDFRSPGTGLYDNLQKYNLPYPEAVFDLSFFARKPQPFVTLAKELWPTGLTFKPTITHSFLSLLARKEKLLRVYSQNIDGLEHLAQLPTEKLVECHGHFRSASCIRCGAQATDMDMIRETIVEKSEAPVCQKCRAGYVKPDIVFFGEGLPNRFHRLLPKDVKETDCCLVLGTSLQVAPVSNIPDMVHRRCSRMLFNRERVGSFTRRKNDLVELGECDASARKLAKLLGWERELNELHERVESALSSNKAE